MKYIIKCSLIEREGKGMTAKEVVAQYGEIDLNIQESGYASAVFEIFTYLMTGSQAMIRRLIEHRLVK